MMWQTGTPLEGRQVLAVVQQSCRRVIVRAVYLGKSQEEAAAMAEVGYEPELEYCEETDTYYYKEGWYEQIDYWGDLCSVWIDDPVTHWMPLPDLPPKPNGVTP